MTWTQTYDPLGSSWLSTLVAAIPVVVLLGLLASGRVPAQKATLARLLSALLVAVFVYVPEANGLGYGERVAAWLLTMLMATVNGAAFGLLPIGWIVLAALFLYNLT